MGGKNPTIVLADADFNSGGENTVNAAFFSTGQKCTATSRVIVEEAIYDRFVDALDGAYEEAKSRETGWKREWILGRRSTRSNWKQISDIATSA